MDCKEFRVWLSESRSVNIAESPSVSAHYEACAACRAAADDESGWKQLFAAIPVRAPERSLWPGIARAIHEHRLGLSLSDALLLFSRRLAPAFAILLLIIGGFLMWSAPDTEAEGGSMIAMLETGSSGFVEEPDAILISWAEARGQ